MCSGKISGRSVAALAAMLFGFSAHAATDVAIVGSWVQGLSHAAESGSDRALLFFAHVEDYSADQWIESVTYGGQPMTKVEEMMFTGSPTRSYVAAFILDDAAIAAASNGNFAVTWDHTPSWIRPPGYSSVFLENVDQSTLTGATDTGGGTEATVTTGDLLSAQGDMVLVAATAGQLGTFTVNNGFAKGTEASPGSADGVAGYKLSTGQSETPSVTHSWGGYVTAVLGFVIRSNEPGGGGTPPTNAELIDALEEAVPYYLEYYGAAGLNVAVARDGEIVWEAGYGYADLADETAYATSTIMRSGSMGKPVTAIATMQLVEDAAFSLSDEATNLLSNVDVENPNVVFPPFPPATKPVTIHHLLTHQSGLLTNVAAPDVAPPDPLETHLLEQLGRSHWEPYAASYLGPIWWMAPDVAFMYSNTGYSVLGLVVEENNAGALSFSNYVKNQIFDPLDMTSSVYPEIQDAQHVPSAIWNAQSTGYAQYGQVYIPTVPTHFGDYPAGNIMSTPGDMVRLLMTMQNSGTSPENDYELLGPGTVAQMLTQEVETTDPTYYGLGWYLTNQGTSDYTFGHAGAHMYGHNNDMRVFPETGIAVCVATNTYNMVPDRTIIAQAIAVYTHEFLQGTPPDISEVLDTYQWVQPGSGSTDTDDWEWKTSYAIGLMLAERLIGSIGVTGTITTSMVDDMVGGVVERINVSQSGSSVWSEDGFRNGFADMQGVSPMTRTAVLGYVSSGNMQITSQELETIYYELGGDDFDNNAFGKVH